MTVARLLEKDSKWPCPRCDYEGNKVDTFCKSCFAYKPLLFYKNLISKPFNVTPDELLQLNQRREHERLLVLKADETESTSKIWYFISLGWL